MKVTVLFLALVFIACAKNKSLILRIPIGDVKIIGYNEEIPYGYRVMTFEEGTKHKKELSRMLD
jgi:hypothetical protein